MAELHEACCKMLGQWPPDRGHLREMYPARPKKQDKPELPPGSANVYFGGMGYQGVAIDPEEMTRRIMSINEH